MKVVVLVKQVPDTYGDRRITVETGLVDRAASDAVADEIGERAIEAALAVGRAVPGTTVTAVTLGPERATEALKKALAMGADDAVHVLDPGLAGADMTLTAEVLAAAIRPMGADLVLAGNTSTDGAGGVLPAMLAEHLGTAHVTNLSTLEVDGSVVRGTRVVDGGVAAVCAVLPAVASITDALPDPRFPSFKGLMAAKKKPVRTVSAQELGADLAGAHAARAIVIAAAERPARLAGTTIVDEGDGGTKLADFLIAQKLA